MCFGMYCVCSGLNCVLWILVNWGQSGMKAEPQTNKFDLDRIKHRMDTSRNYNATMTLSWIARFVYAILCCCSWIQCVLLKTLCSHCFSYRRSWCCGHTVVFGIRFCVVLKKINERYIKNDTKGTLYVHWHYSGGSIIICV